MNMLNVTFCGKKSKQVEYGTVAASLLDEFEASELIGFVIDGNYKEITRAKGVGPKLAQKIILELKDKLMNYQISYRSIKRFSGII